MASVHKLLLTVLLGFLFTAIPGPAVIRFLKRMNFRQTERKEGPQSHLKKAGTPTMGGVFLLLGWLLAALIGVREGFSLVLPVLLVMVLCGLMGFLDDFIKISSGTSMGLLPYQRGVRSSPAKSVNLVNLPSRLSHTSRVMALVWCLRNGSS